VTGDDGEWTADLGGAGVTLSGVDGTFVVADKGDGRFQVGRGTMEIAAVATAGPGDAVWVGIDGQVFEFRVRPEADAGARVGHDHEALSPPMSATVVRIAVRPGSEVVAGETLVVLEAMKMELPIRAPRAGVVRAVHCREGELVQPGTVLVEFA